ncbi:MAG: hypothetical protein AAF291_16300 [Pseudomonadota bacterium]
MFRALAAALCLCLAVSAPAEASRVADRACKTPAGWSEIEETGTRFVVFGEVHGTRESPVIVGELLCALAQGGESVLLAVELDSTRNAALQEVWQGSLDTYSDALLELGWARREDGVTSKAMHDLMILARRTKEDGLKVGVVAFNGAKDADQRDRFARLPGQGPHEAAQAQNIFDAAKHADYDRILVLVGGFHARKIVTMAGGVEIEPMAMKLARLGPTVTLHNRYADGTNWGCALRKDFTFEPRKRVTKADVTCGAQRTRGWEDDGSPAHMTLGAFRGEPLPAYDGYFWLGPIHASPPAAEQEEGAG